MPSSAGESINGSFHGEIAAAPPQAHVGQDGKTVVEGGAIDDNSP